MRSENALKAVINPTSGRTEYEILEDLVEMFGFESALRSLCEISEGKPPTIITAVRRFLLWRTEDATGISGTGLVAMGSVWPNGKAVLLWRGEHSSIAIYDSMDSLVAIHCHGGKSEVMFIDGEN